MRRRKRERVGEAFLRRRLYDRELYRVWSNFEFTTANGLLYAIDALAIPTTVSGRPATDRSASSRRQESLIGGAHGPVDIQSEPERRRQ